MKESIKDWKLQEAIGRKKTIHRYQWGKLEMNLSLGSWEYLTMRYTFQVFIKLVYRMGK